MIYQASKTPAVCRVCDSSDSKQVATIRDSSIFRCADCGTAFAHYPEATAELAHADHFAGLDLERYFRSVKATRERSYVELLHRIQRFRTSGHWLDIGCSYGWLLDFMRTHGFEVSGVEPSEAAADHAEQVGLRVHRGLFPAAVPSNTQVDVLSFMDVLEHLPSPGEALTAAHRLVTDDGLLVVQVPDQQCFLYRLAEWLHRGSGGRCSFALQRLWLMDFDFPHQTYFTQHSLTRLLTQQGWRVRDAWRSPVGNPLEALDRVSYTAANQQSRWKNHVVALGVAGIQLADTACGHGGLLTVIASRERPAPC
jgi:SAM-dependent methyltransferase